MGSSEAASLETAADLSSPPILAASILALVLGLLLFFLLQSFRQPHHVPPGRLGLPLIGETLEWLHSRSKGPDQAAQFYRIRMDKYGEIFKTGLLGSPTVVVNTPSANKFLFANENKLVVTRWPSSIARVFGKDSILGQTPDEAKRTRSALMTFLKPDALHKFTAKADRVAKKHVEQYWEGKEQVTVYPNMRRFAFSVASCLFMGREVDAKDEKLEEVFMTLSNGLSGLPIDFPGTPYRRALTAANILRHQIARWMEQWREEEISSAGTASAHLDLLSYMLNYRDELGQPLSDDYIQANIILVLYAGHDTTAVTLTMLCKHLAENPQSLEEVWKEQQEIASRKKPGELLNWEDLKSMKLSWRAVQETLRLQPPAHGGFRKVIKEFQIGGYTIPNGWQVFWSLTATQYSDKFFPEAKKFDPSRFEGAGPAPYTFCPFGGGPRMCPGNEFTRMETLVLLHNLVTRFKWKQMLRDEQVTIGAVPYPVKGLPVWLERRS